MAVGNGSSLEYWIKLISVKVGSWKGEGCWAALKPKVDLSRLAKYANEMVINANNIKFQFDLLPRLNAIGNPSSRNNTVFLYITITIVVKEAEMLKSILQMCSNQLNLYFYNWAVHVLNI